MSVLAILSGWLVMMCAGPNGNGLSLGFALAALGLSIGCELLDRMAA